MRRSATSGPYESAVSMRLIPNSTARRRTAIASEWSAGSPHTPAPVSCIVPKPSRRTGMSPPITNVPLASAGRTLDAREDRGVALIVLMSFIIFGFLFGLRVFEKRHETVVHVQLLVAMEKRQPWIIRNKVHLGFLVSAQHHHIF